MISKTYLREALKYQIKIFLDEEDYYVSVKKLIDVSDKWIIRDDICVIDKGYYIFEVVPKNENYAMRLFLNEKKEPLEYYFDICKNNGLIDGIPFYDDLYLDITYLNGEINIWDEEELLEAYKENDITDEDYELVYKIKDKLLIEIRNKTNKYLHLDYMKYLDNF